MGENATGKYLAIARILRPQGRKGEVAAEILTDFPERFQQLQTAFLEVPGQAPKPVSLERSWPHKGQIILKFAGIDSIEHGSFLDDEALDMMQQRGKPHPDGDHGDRRRDRLDLFHAAGGALRV